MLRTYIHVDENNVALDRVYVYGEVDAPVRVIPVSDPQQVELGSKWNGSSWVVTEELLRRKRDEALVENVDPVAGNVLRWSAMTELQKESLSNYRQELLDLPQQNGFPENIVWPQFPF